MSARLLALVAFLLAQSASVARAAPELEWMSGLGVGKATGEGADSVNRGLGLLFAGGLRLNRAISLQGQLNLDWPRTEEMSYVDAFWIFRAQVVPALHLGDEDVDIAVGPSFGFLYMHTSRRLDGVQQRFEASLNVRGYTIGLQAWLMFTVGASLTLGPVLSYGRFWATNSCLATTGQFEQCDRDPSNDGSPGYWNISAALRF